jgi:hypothetical protein
MIKLIFIAAMALFVSKQIKPNYTPSERIATAISTHIKINPHPRVLIKDEVGGSDYCGMYYDKFNTIELQKGYEEIIYPHEFGHSVWYAQNNDFRERYTDIRQGTDWFPSEYAKKNIIEDFAECFTFYIFDTAMPNDVSDFLKANLN